MRSRYRLAILFSLLILSLTPIVFFFIFDYPHAEHFIRALLYGTAGIDVNVSKNWFTIYGKTFFGVIRFDLSYVILLFASVIAFFICFALIIRNLVKFKVPLKLRIALEELNEPEY
jgi:hypothetical protein